MLSSGLSGIPAQLGFSDSLSVLALSGFKLLFLPHTTWHSENCTGKEILAFFPCRDFKKIIF